MSSLPDAVDLAQIQRKEKDGTKVKINCPKAICTYNANMGLIDQFDQLMSLNEVDRKSKKNGGIVYFSIFWMQL